MTAIHAERETRIIPRQLIILFATSFSGASIYWLQTVRLVRKDEWRIEIFRRLPPLDLGKRHSVAHPAEGDLLHAVQVLVLKVLPPRVQQRLSRMNPGPRPAGCRGGLVKFLFISKESVTATY
jgi:hypothetical protein